MKGSKRSLISKVSLFLAAAACLAFLVIGGWRVLRSSQSQPASKTAATSTTKEASISGAKRDVRIISNSQQILAELYQMSNSGKQGAGQEKAQQAKTRLEKLVNEELFTVFSNSVTDEALKVSADSLNDHIKLEDMAVIPQVDTDGDVGALVACKNLALQELKKEGKTTVPKDATFYTVFTMKFNKNASRLTKFDYRFAISEEGFNELKELAQQAPSRDGFAELFAANKTIFTQYGTLSYTDKKETIDEGLKKVQPLMTPEVYELLFGGLDQSRQRNADVDANYTNSLHEPVSLFAMGGDASKIQAVVFLRQSSVISDNQKKDITSGKKFLWIVDYDRPDNQLTQLKQVAGLENGLSGLNVPDTAP